VDFEKINNWQRQTDLGFEKLIYFAIRILSNSLTILIALVTVIFWLSNKWFYSQNLNDRIGDIISGISFLSVLIIQRSFRRFSTSLHLKVNELVKSHGPASNTVMSMEGKTDRDIAKMLTDYTKQDQTSETATKKT
jgi:low affinity Fe/Cu permease